MSHRNYAAMFGTNTGKNDTNDKVKTKKVKKIASK